MNLRKPGMPGMDPSGLAAALRDPMFMGQGATSGAGGPPNPMAGAGGPPGAEVPLPGMSQDFSSGAPPMGQGPLSGYGIQGPPADFQLLTDGPSVWGTDMASQPGEIMGAGAPVPPSNSGGMPPPSNSGGMPVPQPIKDPRAMAMALRQPSFGVDPFQMK